MDNNGHQVDVARLGEFVSSDPVVAAVSRCASGLPLYLVGGSVRDVLTARRPSELDFVVEGPVEAVARALDPEARIFERFGTAEATVENTAVDLASARRETYPEPGALPVVEPADLESDLGRRDFTVNAIAIPIEGASDPIDPFDGLGDLRRGVLRVLHPDSFSDDPTRALRAARYCARLGLSPDPQTEEALRSTDLTTVSRDRIQREMGLVAAEEDPAVAIGLLVEWGLLEASPGVVDLARDSYRLLEGDRWFGTCSRQQLLEAVLSSEMLEISKALVSEPEDPWDGYLLITSVSPAALLLARAAGADWLDRWPEEWADIRLRITGEDLVRAGVPEGPEIGAGLEAALRDRVLNGDRGAERELSVALEESLGRGPA